MTAIRHIPSCQDASVLVVGVGGLGCPAALALADEAVGRLTLVDPDVVEPSNLPRQLLYEESDIGEAKAKVAARALAARNASITIEAIKGALTADNAAQLFDGADFVIDATDGVETKMLINDAALASDTPYCHAGVIGFGGQLLTVVPGNGPCLRCVFPDLAEGIEEEEASCRQAGIVGPVAGLFGALQAHHALAYLAGHREPKPTLHTYDGLADRWRHLDVSTTPPCARCSAGKEGERPQWAM